MRKACSSILAQVDDFNVPTHSELQVFSLVPLHWAFGMAQCKSLMGDIMVRRVT